MDDRIVLITLAVFWINTTTFAVGIFRTAFKEGDKKHFIK